MVFNARIDVEQTEYSRAKTGATLQNRGTFVLPIITVREITTTYSIIIKHKYVKIFLCETQQDKIGLVCQCEINSDVVRL